MKDSELQMLCDHMGHSTNIHTSVYKLQQSLIERSKVAQILLASEQGTLVKYKEPTALENVNPHEIHILSDEGKCLMSLNFEIFH